MKKWGMCCWWRGVGCGRIIRWWKSNRQQAPAETCAAADETDSRCSGGAYAWGRRFKVAAAGGWAACGFRGNHDMEGPWSGVRVDERRRSRGWLSRAWLQGVRVGVDGGRVLVD